MTLFGGSLSRERENYSGFLAPKVAGVPVRSVLIAVPPDELLVPTSTTDNGVLRARRDLPSRLTRLRRLTLWCSEFGEDEADAADEVVGRSFV
jgi:hypothetical protein